jgi:hypothetical protein
MQVEAIPAQRTLGPWWVVASAAAAAVGIAVGRPLAELAREPFDQALGGLPIVALFGAFFGLCLGLGHTLAQQRIIPAFWWTLASALGGAAGFALGVKAATLITDPLRGQVIVYASEVFAYLIFGAALGALLGLTQSVTWRAGGWRVAEWTGASALGWALGFTVTAGIGLMITQLPSLTVRDALFGGVAGLIAGGTQALVAAWRYRR